MNRRGKVFVPAVLAAIFLVLVACERPAGDTRPVVTPELSDRLTAEAQEQSTEAAESQPTVVVPPGATPQAAGASTRMPTWDRDSIPIEYVGTPCHPEIILEPIPWLSDQFVQWRPEGDEVLFTQGAELSAVRADGGLAREVASGAVRGAVRGAEVSVRRGAIGRMMAFDIAPDGKQVAYSTCEYPKGDFGEAAERLGWREAMNRHRYQIVAASIDGGAPQQLTEDIGFANYPSWSPDGERIAFLAGGDPLFLLNEVSLMTMAADGSDQRVIVDRFNSLALRPPVWSPDGTHLAFASGDGESVLWIYTVRADGSYLRGLTDTLSGPAWSPDGQRIAFTKADGRTVAIYTMAADGTDERRVTTIPEVVWDPDTPDRVYIRTLEWSPDGSKILFIENRELAENDCSSPTKQGVYVVGTDGSGLVGLGISEPSVYLYAAAAWSPDGTRIAILADAEHEYQRAFSCDYTELTMEDIPRRVILFTMAPDGTDVRVLVRD